MTTKTQLDRYREEARELGGEINDSAQDFSLTTISALKKQMKKG